MIKFYFFVLFSGILLSSEYKIDIEPDSIFIGTQASIMVSFPTNNDQKTYIFNDININSEKISLIDKVLFHNSATYKIQIWEEGDIKIPSIIIDILKNNKFIDRISINDIHLFSYSNINYSNDNIRNI